MRDLKKIPRLSVSREAFFCFFFAVGVYEPQGLLCVHTDFAHILAVVDLHHTTSKSASTSSVYYDRSKFRQTPPSPRRPELADDAGNISVLEQ